MYTLDINMEEYNYDALASSVKIKDITSNERNRETLRRLKGNHPLKTLWISNVDDGDIINIDYCPGNNVEELGWLGYYLGRNTSLNELYFFSRTINDAYFYIGLNHNTSIKKIGFQCIDLQDGQIWQMVAPFLENNHNLTYFEVGPCE